MNELRFLEALGRIGDDLIREADAHTARKPVRTVRWVCAVGAAAAAAVIAVGTAAVYHAHKPAAMLAKPPVTQQNDSRGTGGNKLQPEASADAADAAPAQTDSRQPAAADTPHSEDSTAPHTQTAAGTHTEMTSAAHTDAGQKGGVPLWHAYFAPFTAEADPDSDAYGEDEEHHIDVRTADGFYRQLALADYAANGLSGKVSLSSFGGYIGKITEVSDYDYHGNAAESQEPALAGADVYYYAPTAKNRAFIIVKKGDQCSMFIADSINTGAGFRSGLAFYDVQRADDIRSMEYRIEVPEGYKTVTAVQNTVTAPQQIAAVYDLLCSLTPEDYSLLPAHIGTPQWLVDAWSAYRSDPNAPAREDYRITFTLKDGTVLQPIDYQPYLGNGYVEHMQELTPEQNAALRALLPKLP